MTLAVHPRLRVVTAEQIMRSIATSHDPCDELIREEPLAFLALRPGFSPADRFGDLPDTAKVNAKTVAERLNVSMHSVWRWAREGMLPTVRRADHRRGYLFNVGDLRKALRS